MDKIKVAQSFDDEAKTRNGVIVKTSIIGIAANVILVIFKMSVGFLSNSIAVVLDAVNNLTDAISSVVTIVGTKLAAKMPDKKHPLGYGRIEYISETIVAAIILYAGINSLIQSVKSIITPEEPDYSTTAIIILVVAVLVKVVLGIYVKNKGKKVKSGALEASGKDALFDAILSSSVLVSALIYIIFHVSLEAYVGVLISAFIIKSGVEMLMDPINQILGKRADSELSKKIKKVINEDKDVIGAYDLFINNYGPNTNYASVHIELPDVMTVDKVDVITRRLQKQVYARTGVVLTGVGVYSYNTTDTEAAKIRNDVNSIVFAHDWVLQMHGFYIDNQAKSMRFDVVMSFDIDPKEGLEIINRELKEVYPEYTLIIVPDVDITDI